MAGGADAAAVAVAAAPAVRGGKPYNPPGTGQRLVFRDWAGRHDQARRHRQDARQLWVDCDPELCALLGDSPRDG
jgi:hypothetical protein